MRALWALARVTPGSSERQTMCYWEPVRPAIFDFGQFARLTASQPWATARHWEDGNYQYALCTKAVGTDWLASTGSGGSL